MNLYLFGALVPVLLSLLIQTSKRKKPRGVPVDVGGELGIALRNPRYTSPLETAWKDVSTLAELFEQSCMKFPNRHLLGSRKLISKETEISEDGREFEKLHLGEYEWLSYYQVLEAVQSFSSGLVRLGHTRDEHVAIISDTRFEWFLTLQGCFRRNVTVVTIYASLGDEALYHSLDETEVSTIICGQKELKKIIAVGGRLNSVKRVICMDDYISSDRRNGRWEILTFDHVVKLGREHPSNPDLPISSDIAVIMYTSGSTGMPKGVMMTHGNLLATVSALRTIIPRLGSSDVYLAYLPLAHVLELVAENLITSVGSAIGYGSPLTLTDASSKVKKGTKGDATALRPTLMAAVPAILDRVRDSVHKMVENKGGIRKKLFDLAYTRKLSALNGRWYGGSTLENFLWYFFVFRKVGAILGGRIRLVLSGGAPLSADTQRFINICFRAPVGQGYGLTETCAGGTFLEFDDTSVDSVGPPVPCSYIKLVDWVEGGYRTSDKPMPRGEVIIGGPCVTVGYFKNEEKTHGAYEVDERGVRWFRTEDIGQIRSDGCLQIIDRKKDIVKLQHGEYISLRKVEAVLSKSAYVDNVMVHADPSSSYCVALIVVSRPALQNWASSRATTYTDFPDLCANPQAINEVYSSLLKAAKEAGLERFEIPAKVKLLADGWTQESDLVSVSMKLKREAVRKAFSNELSKLYAS